MNCLDLTTYIGKVIGKVKRKKEGRKRRNEKYGIWGVVKIYLLCVVWGWSASIIL
mgnify:CR=1 FL=1